MPWLSLPSLHIHTFSTRRRQPRAARTSAEHAGTLLQTGGDGGEKQRDLTSTKSLTFSISPFATTWWNAAVALAVPASFLAGIKPVLLNWFVATCRRKHRIKKNGMLFVFLFAAGARRHLCRVPVGLRCARRRIWLALASQRRGWASADGAGSDRPPRASALHADCARELKVAPHRRQQRWSLVAA